MMESEAFSSNMFQNTTTIVDDTEDDNPCEDEVGLSFTFSQHGVMKRLVGGRVCGVVT